MKPYADLRWIALVITAFSIYPHQLMSQDLRYVASPGNAVIARLSDDCPSEAISPGVLSSLSDLKHEQIHYPAQVSHRPGFPKKPRWERPGDFNQRENPPIRYCQEENFRAGWPSDVRMHATCSVNSRYSAWYVGGGAAWLCPYGRCRNRDEGTWGLDYSLWSRPQSVWMKWTHGLEQGGLGAYATDRE